MFIKVFSRCDHIVEGGFGLAKTQVHQATGHVIDENLQATLVAASFKPVTALKKLINTGLTL
ncbi:hypothetical protein VEJY3_19826 [Vibrio sp. EJY3]|nr:hypothetical protein VEJY3_19826 [Vibrio sp. EJY3]